MVVGYMFSIWMNDTSYLAAGASVQQDDVRPEGDSKDLCAVHATRSTFSLVNSHTGGSPTLAVDSSLRIDQNDGQVS
ncbi:hypothetical protein VTO73DRAFT_12703 [Trametes versicolor]